MRPSVHLLKGTDLVSEADDDLSCGEMLRRLQDNPELRRLRPDSQGRYAWDRWQQTALAAGLTPDLASLGRSVMREAVQHDWCPDLCKMCGWEDQGQAMLELAQQDPVIAEELWNHLLETDGLRGRWTETGEWESFDR